MKRERGGSIHVANLESSRRAWRLGFNTFHVDDTREDAGDEQAVTIAITRRAPFTFEDLRVRGCTEGQRDHFELSGPHNTIITCHARPPPQRLVSLKVVVPVGNPRWAKHEECTVIIKFGAPPEEDGLSVIEVFFSSLSLSFASCSSCPLGCPSLTRRCRRELQQESAGRLARAGARARAPAAAAAAASAVPPLATHPAGGVHRPPPPFAALPPAPVPPEGAVPPRRRR